MKKGGSTGEWFFVILVMLVIGGLVFFISSTMFSKKAEVYTKNETNNLLKNSCTYFDFSTGAYLGQIPRTICKNINMEPKFLIIQENVQVQPGSGYTIYSDTNSQVDIISFDTVLTQAVDTPVQYGNPSAKNIGVSNKYTNGLLCCR
ncbi:MAG: hypothetical protein NTW17_00010 [Candidatus Pacearchaeota archaeon]|nr:hypothetical protein [Candidatus Pacearchaeota archaeon]